MPEPQGHQCPECQTGLGVARAVTTVPGGLGLTLVTLVCQLCSHQWKIERQDPLVASTRRAS